ncbi:MAG: nucleotide exchange factor GrpE [Proteobacteria bacterium]|nr:nucleotide exchange factor GrpE [Pseudomonadota bacterium]
MNTSNESDPLDDQVMDAPVDATPEGEIADVDFQAEAAKLKDLALRARADLDNFRKRSLREKEDAIRYANNGLLEKLLPVIDNFELGLEAARNATDAASVLQGMTMVHRQLQDFIRSQGLEEVPAEGESFDPNKHDAVSQEFSADIAEGQVIRQVRKGYKLKDRLLRAASVIVSKGAQ